MLIGSGVGSVDVHPNAGAWQCCTDLGIKTRLVLLVIYAEKPVSAGTFLGCSTVGVGQSV